MIRNIIFDWSGTLVNDLPAVWRATNHVLAQAGHPELTLDEFRDEFELPFTRFYERKAPQASLPQLEEWFHSFFPSVLNLIEDLPYSREILRHCREQKIHVTLLSAIPHSQYDYLTARNGFADFFDGVYLDVRDKCKVIHEALEEHNLDPSATLFVGDMQHDIDAANAGGVHSCAVLTGYNKLPQLRASNPSIVVEHLGELLEILQNDKLPERLNDADYEIVSASPIATVGGLIFNSRNEVLMLQTQKWSHLWGMPGGKIKPNESSVNAFQREVKEETGLNVTDIQFELTQDCIQPEEFYRPAHFILLNYICKAADGQTVTLNDEAQAFQWTTLENALDLPLNKPTENLIRAILAAQHPAT